MALTLPRDRTAVVVIECQNDLIHESKIGTAGIGGALAAAVRERNVLQHIAKVVHAARGAQVPVLYANKESKPGVPTTNAPIFRIGRRNPILIEGTWGADVHSAIAPTGGDYEIRRFLSVDASYGSSLFGTLRALGRTLISDCIGFRKDGDQLLFTRQMFQGKFAADVAFTGEAPYFATFQTGAYRADKAEAGASAAPVETGK